MTADRHPRLPTDTDDGLLLVISGPSGVGKTTITRAVERSIPDSVFSVSATTRAKTDADVEGVDYHFKTECQFDAMVSGGEFLEWAGVFGKRYGTPRAWVDEQLVRGRLVILEIDVEGAKQVKQAMPEAFGVFILPPSEEELLRRLRSRKREDESLIEKRFAEARREIDEANKCGAYDSFIVNDDLEHAIGDAVRAVRDERARRRVSKGAARRDEAAKNS
ncbi:MAG: guanylate kinase [Phycisphaerales bacterium]